MGDGKSIISGYFYDLFLLHFKKTCVNLTTIDGTMEKSEPSCHNLENYCMWFRMHISMVLQHSPQQAIAIGKSKTKRISFKFQKTKTKLKCIDLFSNTISIGLSLVAVKVKYVFGLLESKLKLWRHLWKSIEVVSGRFKWSTTMIKQWVQVPMVPVLSGI